MCCGKNQSNKGRSRKVRKITPPPPSIKKEEEKKS